MTDIECVKAMTLTARANKKLFMNGTASRILADIVRDYSDVRLRIMVNDTHLWLTDQVRGRLLCHKMETDSSEGRSEVSVVLQKKFFTVLSHVYQNVLQGLLYKSELLQTQFQLLARDKSSDGVKIVQTNNLCEEINKLFLHDCPRVQVDADIEEIPHSVVEKVDEIMHEFQHLRDKVRTRCRNKVIANNELETIHGYLSMMNAQIVSVLTSVSNGSERKDVNTLWNVSGKAVILLPVELSSFQRCIKTAIGP